jgi:hypothetical protein
LGPLREVEERRRGGGQRRKIFRLDMTPKHTSIDETIWCCAVTSELDD